MSDLERFRADTRRCACGEPPEIEFTRARRKRHLLG